MHRDNLEIMLRYNHWSNMRILKLLSALSQEQFTRNLGSSYGSIQETLAHVLFCEELWLMRWKGISPTEMGKASEVPDLQSFEARWVDHNLDVQNFFLKMSDETLQEVIEFNDRSGHPWAYPLWQMMHHLLNHSTYHRGQIITMLRQLGAHAEALDFLDFIDEGNAAISR